MPRYIDADALLEKLKKRREFWGFTFTADGVDKAIDEVEEAPDADVAPKSEVAREIFAEIKKAIKEETLDYCNGFEKAETLELQEYFKTKQNTAIFLYMKIDNLEKKYTEEKE